MFAECAFSKNIPIHEISPNWTDIYSISFGRIYRKQIYEIQGPNLPHPNFPGPKLPGPNLPGPNLPGLICPEPHSFASMFSNLIPRI